MMQSNDSILVTGAQGLAGSHLVTHLREQGFTAVIGIGSAECDLTDRRTTIDFFARVRPSFVFHMAGHVFGIMGNMKNQAEAYLQNNLINTHVIEASQKAGAKKIVAMGTVAMYPDPLPSNPLREETIWQGAPHASEFGYAHAKRGMLAQLEAYHKSYGMDYACALSTNLYGTHDRFNIETGHVIPSLIRKFFEAKQSGEKISIWGDGSAKRDFLYIKDAAQGLRLMMDKLQGAVNLATGTIYTIRDAVDVLAHYTGQQDKVIWDASKPNGQLYRAYDTAKMVSAGFTCQYSLEQGLRETYDWYATHETTARK